MPLYTQENLKLVGTSAGPPETSSETAQGHSIGINADDGTWMITGSGGADNGEGEAYIFRRIGTDWLEHAMIPCPVSDATFPQFGFSVAISADGTRIIVGAPGGSSGDTAGIVFIFDYDSVGDEWGSPNFISGPAGLGWSVALSHDGTVAAIASVYDEETLIYRDTGSWTLDDTLPGGDAAALSGDGNTLFVLIDGGDAAIYFFDSGWTEQTTVTNVIDWPNGTVPFALSYDGDRAAVGLGSGGLFYTGSVLTLVRTAGVWTEDAIIDAPVDAEGTNVLFGASIASSNDGRTLAIGGPGDQRVGGTQEAIGALWVFQRPLIGPWAEEDKYLPSDFSVIGGANAALGEGRVFFGASVSITANRERIAIGAPDDDNSGFPDFATYGASWIFVSPIALSVNFSARFPRT